MTDEQTSSQLNPVPTSYVWAMLGIFALSGAILYLFWDQVPDPIPTHFGPSGEADGFSEKSLSTVFGTLGVLAVILFGVLLVSMYGMHHQAKTAHEGFPKRTEQEVVRARVRANEMIPVIGRFMVAITALTMFSMTFSFITLRFPGWIFTILFLLIMGWLLWASGRAQRRIDEQAGPSEISQHLVGGVFYFNRDDDRLFIDIPTGLTLNMARPVAWVLVLSPLLLIALLFLFL